MGKRTRATRQPDYEKWQAVAIGMPYDEVRARLGEPEYQLGMARTPREPYYLRFGCIYVPSIPAPSWYCFMIGFDRHDRVWMKSDPFDGVLSKNGLPAKPQLIVPLEGSVFDHYPRTLDLRWGPVSGIYPIKYDGEIGSSIDRLGSYHVVERFREIDGPYFLCNYGGAGHGRFRVRGSNAIGVGEWSEYRHFTFTR